MAPKAQRVPVQKADSSRRVGSAKKASKGYITDAYHTLTSAENASVVRSVAIFGVAIAFFASSWSEVLLPPL